MNNQSNANLGPHARVAAETPRERFTLELFDRLWNSYRERVTYVQTYESVVRQRGGTFVNDHIAFRTLATQQAGTGMHSLSRIFEALGYVAAGCYQFADKSLSAIHYQHPHPQFPKLFISELKSWELPAEDREAITQAMASHRPPISEEELARLHRLSNPAEFPLLLDRLENWFTELPWELPQRNAVETLNRVSQYGAWVLVHGYRVNHFTSLVNSHGVAALENLEGIIAAMVQAGVPMKAEIEGEPGSRLRQTATEAVKSEVQVREGEKRVAMPWSYAYFELAERNWETDPVTGNRVRFEGFLGPQATNLFEMTRVK